MFMKKKQLQLDQVESFHILPVQLTQSVHYMYMKQHETRQPDPRVPTDRTLFVLNVPVYATRDDLRRLFHPCGRVESVHLGLGGSPDAYHPPNTRVYVVFLESKGLERALSLQLSKPLVWNDPKVTVQAHDPPQRIGLDRYEHLYALHRPSTTELKAALDCVVTAHYQQLDEEKELAMKGHNKVDQDGFILVTKSGNKRGNASDGVVHVTATRSTGELKAKKELVDFYKFQKRETKRDELKSLRERFEQDKSRIQLMKSMRKFKPY
jgi:ribosomal RNA-processing protein 7